MTTKMTGEASPAPCSTVLELPTLIETSTPGHTTRRDLALAAFASPLCTLNLAWELRLALLPPAAFFVPHRRSAASSSTAPNSHARLSSVLHEGCCLRLLFRCRCRRRRSRVARILVNLSSYLAINFPRPPPSSLQCRRFPSIFHERGRLLLLLLLLLLRLLLLC